MEFQFWGTEARLKMKIPSCLCPLPVHRAINVVLVMSAFHEFQAMPHNSDLLILTNPLLRSHYSLTWMNELGKYALMAREPRMCWGVNAPFSPSGSHVLVSLTNCACVVFRNVSYSTWKKILTKDEVWPHWSLGWKWLWMTIGRGGYSAGDWCAKLFSSPPRQSFFEFPGLAPAR